MQHYVPAMCDSVSNCIHATATASLLERGIGKAAKLLEENKLALTLISFAWMNVLNKDNKENVSEMKFVHVFEQKATTNVLIKIQTYTLSWK